MALADLLALPQIEDLCRAQELAPTPKYGSSNLSGAHFGRDDDRKVLSKGWRRGYLGVFLKASR